MSTQEESVPDSWEDIDETSLVMHNDSSNSEQKDSDKRIIDLALLTIELQEINRKLDALPREESLQLFYMNEEAQHKLERKIENIKRWTKETNPGRNVQPMLDDKRQLHLKKIQDELRTQVEKLQEANALKCRELKQVAQSIRLKIEQLAATAEEIEEAKKLEDYYNASVANPLQVTLRPGWLANVKCSFTEQAFTDSSLAMKDNSCVNDDNNNNSDQNSLLIQRTDKFLSQKGLTSFDAAFEATFHFHSGQAIKQIEPGESNERSATQYRFWHLYAKSLQSEVTPNLMLEFSQNLDTELTVMKDKPLSKGKAQSIKGNTIQVKQQKFLKSLHDDPLPFTSKEKAREQLKALLMQVVQENLQTNNRDIAATFEYTCDILDQFRDLLTVQDKEFLQHTFKQLGFPEDAEYITGKPTSLQSARFQLENLGPSFLRKQNPVYFPHKDVRFYPDDWQHTLLQVIAKKESALVVAPTSSGKSFISFFTISTILGSPSEVPRSKGMKSRVVFVSPTLALANQMAANVYMRYEGIIKFGIFTRDWRINVTNCDLLICTPGEFQVLLLSPQLQNWANELEFVVFDEVHMIASSNEDEEIDTLSSSYVKILALIPCPFLALSASITNASELVTWLSSVSNRAIHLLPNKHIRRWTDLQMHHFKPTGNISPIHPVSLVTEPEDINLLPVLSPIESLQLFDAMKQELSTDQMAELKPEQYFKENLRITRVEQSAYSDKLLRTLGTLPWNSVVDSLSQGIKIPEKQDTLESEGVFKLLQTLFKKKMSPAILFHHDLDDLKKVVDSIVGTLQLLSSGKKMPSREKASRDTTKKEKAESDDIEKRDFRQELIEINKKRVQQKLENWKDLVASIHPDLSFAKFSLESNDIDYWLERVFAKLEWPSRHPLLVAVAHGIGIHDNSIPKPYRDLVEFTFRSGMLSYVFSTRSLIVGINMPVRTVVLLQDSRLLNGINYRQIIGRAGRRGHDKLGYIVFYGFTRQRMRELHIRSLQVIQTSSSLDITTVLKIMILEHASYEKFDRKKTTERLLRLLHPPLNSENGQKLELSDRLENERFFKLSLEWLHGLNLIDKNGRPLGLAGLAAHTPEIAPSNLLLCYLIISGSLNSIIDSFRLNPSNKTREEAKHSIVLLLAHIVFKIRTTSARTLQPLPAAIHEAILKYNKLMKGIYENLQSALQSDLPVKTGPFVNLHAQNCYIYHLYEHRDWTATLTETGLPDGLMYKMIDNLISVLKKIHTALFQLSKEATPKQKNLKKNEVPKGKWDPLVLLFGEITLDFQDILHQATSSYR